MKTVGFVDSFATNDSYFVCIKILQPKIRCVGKSGSKRLAIRIYNWKDIVVIFIHEAFDFGIGGIICQKIVCHVLNNLQSISAGSVTPSQ